MGRHTPTRIDIRTEGWTSGLDVLPLPRECQTATCIHKDHQLSKVKADVELDAAWMRNAVLEKQEKPNRGWVMPSTEVFPVLPPLDLSTISIKRGGLRFYPEFPMYEFRVIKHKMRWQVQFRAHDGRTWIPCPALTFWKLRSALNARDLLRSMQNGTREEYVNRVNAR